MKSVPERPAKNAREAIERFLCAHSGGDIPVAETAPFWAELEQEDPGATERLGRALGSVLYAAAKSMAQRLQADEQERETEGGDTAPPPKPKRTRRLKPSKLAAWEAAWQAEHAANGDES